MEQPAAIQASKPLWVDFNIRNGETRPVESFKDGGAWLQPVNIVRVLSKGLFGISDPERGGNMAEQAWVQSQRNPHPQQREEEVGRLVGKSAGSLSRS